MGPWFEIEAQQATKKMNMLHTILEEMSHYIKFITLVVLKAKISFMLVFQWYRYFIAT